MPYSAFCCLPENKQVQVYTLFLAIEACLEAFQKFLKRAHSLSKLFARSARQ